MTIGTGVLPSQAISAMIAAGALTGAPAILDNQIQPASLDLRLGTTAYRVRASFLAGNDNKVADRLDEFEMHRFSLDGRRQRPAGEAGQARSTARRRPDDPLGRPPGHRPAVSLCPHDPCKDPR